MAATSKFSFPRTEEETLAYWNKIGAFELSLKLSEGKPEFVFYDGPPFATGSPHYGHLLTGSIKDVVCRYWHMNGRHIERRFGWDTHGLPIEFEINKLYGIKTTADVLEIGIAEYNRRCREVVMRCADEWRSTVSRLGRWIDFDNDYRTMYPSYMESVWWVFWKLWDKGLIYRGEKVMAYSTECATPLSNFEANSDYKPRSDPDLFVTFESAEEPGLLFLAWTTTPWTLPSNLALCVHPELTYAIVKDANSDLRFVVLESRLAAVFTDDTNPKLADVSVVDRLPGAALVGKTYRPLFPYFVETHGARAFRIVADTYVKDDSGTGIVHQAPAFGEDDFRVCKANGIFEQGAGVTLPCPLDANARFTSTVADFAGLQVFEANKPIIASLKANGRLHKAGSLVHSYPHCWRSDTPLIYRAIPCWFVRVESMRDQLLENNATTHWVPESVKTRMDNWLAGTTDWAVSRNRFWGTPLPIWHNEDFSEVVCVRSIAELEELSGVRVTDLHRETVDDIVVKSPTTGQPLKRVQEVFDCWWESGAMPYASRHYPFENEAAFENHFPADFIGEGLDQTRGWFYTLLVLSTALFGRAATRNVIVNGLVLAADGKKMSKRLKNYPDPNLMLSQYGADAVRLYLINSVLLKAEELSFRQQGLLDVQQTVFQPWYNSFLFFKLACQNYKASTGKEFVADFELARKSTNIMDRWIITSLQSLISMFRREMETYHLYKVTGPLVDFIDLLTNWFVRFNRSRLKGLDTTVEDQLAALNTLYEVEVTVCKLMAPITPFLTEHLFLNLLPYSNIPEAQRDDSFKSVHFQPFPNHREELVDLRVEEAMGVFKSVIITGRRIRDVNKRPIKSPLREIVVLVDNPATIDILQREASSYVLSELNVFNLSVKKDVSLVRRVIAPNPRELGKKKGAYINAVKPSWGQLDPKALKAKTTETQHAIDAAVNALTPEQIAAFEASGSHLLPEFGLLELTHNDVVFSSRYAAPSSSGASSSAAVEQWVAETAGTGLIVALDLATNKELEEEGIVRDFQSKIQQVRKAAGLQESDPVEAFVNFDKPASTAAGVFATKMAELTRRLRYTVAPVSERSSGAQVIFTKEEDISGDKVFISLCFVAPSVSAELRAKYPSLEVYLNTRSLNALRSTYAVGSKLPVSLDSSTLSLTVNQDIFWSVGERLKTVN